MIQKLLVMHCTTVLLYYCTMPASHSLARTCTCSRLEYQSFEIVQWLENDQCGKIQRYSIYMLFVHNSAYVATHNPDACSMCVQWSMYSTNGIICILYVAQVYCCSTLFPSQNPYKCNYCHSRCIIDVFQPIIDQVDFAHAYYYMEYGLFFGNTQMQWH